MADVKKLRVFIRASLELGRDVETVFGSLSFDERATLLGQFAFPVSKKPPTPTVKRAGKYKVVGVPWVDFECIPSSYKAGMFVPTGRHEMSTRKIDTIKIVRAVTEAGLKEAKDFVEGNCVLYLNERHYGVLLPFFGGGNLEFVSV